MRVLYAAPHAAMRVGWCNVKWRVFTLIETVVKPRKQFLTVDQNIKVESSTLAVFKTDLDKVVAFLTHIDVVFRGDNGSTFTAQDYAYALCDILAFVVGVIPYLRRETLILDGSVT